MTGPVTWTCAVAAVVMSALTQSQESLLRRSDIGGFAPSSFRAVLHLTRPPQATHSIEMWRSGDAKTLIRFLGPREKGRYLLRLGEQLWFVSSSAKKPVRVGASYRLYGSATLDEVLGVRLAQAYDVESVAPEPGAGGASVVFSLRARAEGVLFPRVRYVVHEATARPISATYRLRSGRDATTVEFLEWSSGSALYARRLVVRDHLRNGAVTQVDVVELEARTVPDALFSLEDATGRRALEASGGRTP